MGATMAIEAINAAGGVFGEQLVLISRDDQGEPGEAVKIAEELVFQGWGGPDFGVAFFQYRARLDLLCR